MGEKCTRGHHTLVRVSVAIVLWDLAVGRIQELLNHAGNDLNLACNQNPRLESLSGQRDVGKELGEEKGTDMASLVLGGWRVLEVVREVLDGILLREHPDISTLLE